MVLNDKGYLFLGKSENIGHYSKAFTPVDNRAKLFLHNGDVQIPGQKNIPFLQSSVTTGMLSTSHRQNKPVLDVSNEDNGNDYIALNTSLFERFMPACVIVNRQNEILHFLGESSNYLCLPRGKATSNLFDLLTDGLKATVSTLLKEVRESNHEIQYKNVKFHGEHKDETVTATVTPLENLPSGSEALYAIVFSANDGRGETEDSTEFEIDRVSATRIKNLELELKDYQHRLTSSIAERQNVSEELQAANEEMLTSNEELQSSNEELQSVNQELYTVNAEYQLKLTEVSQLNDDVTNFLASTMVGIMFIDNKMCIRRFTQYISAEFSVMDHDIGRPVNCISYNFVSGKIEDICAEVLQKLVPIEGEIVTNKDKVFFMRVAPYLSAESKVLGCVITFVEITSLKEGQRDLAAAVKDLSIERKAAEDANNAKSDFLSRMSHDIRTPLNSIIGSVNLATEEHNPPETQELLTAINVSSKYLLGLINDILDLSKIESGKIELNEEPYMRQEFLFGIKTIICPLMEFKNIDFTISHNGDGECVIVDKLRFNQIFFNLLSNAAKYTPNGGKVELILERLPDHDKKYGMRYCIRDNGIGMSEEFLKVCFDSFMQEHASLNAEIKGSGLGLAIVKHLVDEMHGTINVKSSVGQGTEFILEFYFNTTDRSVESVISSDIDESVLNGCRVLLVDDNEMNLQITTKLLERKGCLVNIALDGAKAVNTFASSANGYYDIIITDIRMPVMDGLEETRQIRAMSRPDAATIPIIALTADAFNEDMDKTVAAGMTSRLIKPVEPDLMYATIAGLIGR